MFGLADRLSKSQIFGATQIFFKRFWANKLGEKHPPKITKKIPKKGKTEINFSKHLSTNADSNTDTKKSPASMAKFAQQFYTLYEQKFLNLRLFLSIIFPQGFWKSKKVWTLDSLKWGQKDVETEWRKKQKNL